mgnify:CR=1 FL=1
MMEPIPGRALITGAAGFVGKFLAKRLNASGWTVACSDLHAPSCEPGWCACDMADREQVDAMVSWAGPISHVFHLAAVTFVPEAGRDPAKALEVNLLGTVYLTTALTRYAPAARVVMISTAEVYGHPQFLPITESHPLQPTNPYAISKAAADQYCEYLKHTGADVVRARPFNHTGPGQSDLFVLSSFARQIAQIEAGKRPPILQVGNIDSARDFTHVEDVVRAYERLALNGVSGDAYNVCSGKPTTISDALDGLLALSRVEIHVETDPQRMRPVDVAASFGSYEKIERETGWRPELPFDKLLADLLNFWRKHEVS